MPCLKTWGDERPLSSVCSGALLLGCAGYLRDKAASRRRSTSASISWRSSGGVDARRKIAAQMEYRGYSAV
jgi:hypothetical protein